VRDRDGDADVRRRVEVDLVALEAGVDISVAQEGERAHLHEDVRVGGLDAAVRRLGDEPFAKPDLGPHVGRHRDLEVRALPRLG
jgi:hypothetical protein